MKFVTLALAVLLAVGCQAASLQADAPPDLPTYLQHARGLMRERLENFKHRLHSIASRLENDPETKTAIIARADSLYDQAVALQEQVAPMTDSIVGAVGEATAGLRASIQADINTLQTDLEPMRAELRAVVEKHLAEYMELLKPLREKIPDNVEETKGKLMPIIDAIREKVTERMGEVKTMADPYVQEYRERLTAALTQAQEQTKTVDPSEVMQKLAPQFEALKESFQNLFAAIRGIGGDQ